MGKCFLGLWGGVLFGLSYAVSELSCARACPGRCLSGMAEWVLTGGLLTACAVGGHMVGLLSERLTERR